MVAVLLMLACCDLDLHPFGRVGWDLRPFEIQQAVELEDAEKLKPILSRRLLIFSASWCAPCQTVKTELEAMRGTGWKIGAGAVDHIEAIDTDERPELMERWAVDMLPTFIMTEGGRETGRHVGYLDRWDIGELYTGENERPEAKAERPAAAVEERRPRRRGLINQLFGI